MSILQDLLNVDVDSEAGHDLKIRLKRFVSRRHWRRAFAKVKSQNTMLNLLRDIRATHVIAWSWLRYKFSHGQLLRRRAKRRWRKMKWLLAAFNSFKRDLILNRKTKEELERQRLEVLKFDEEINAQLDLQEGGAVPDDAGVSRISEGNEDEELGRLSSSSTQSTETLRQSAHDFAVTRAMGSPMATRKRWQTKRASIATSGRRPAAGRKSTRMSSTRMSLIIMNTSAESQLRATTAVLATTTTCLNRWKSFPMNIAFEQWKSASTLLGIKGDIQDEIKEKKAELKETAAVLGLQAEERCFECGDSRAATATKWCPDCRIAYCQVPWSLIHSS